MISTPTDTRGTKARGRVNALRVIDVIIVLSLGFITQTSQHTTLCIYTILVYIKLIHPSYSEYLSN